MTDTTTYDIAIIGAGPGGYTAGIRARQLGLNAIVIEGENIGGTCLNWGCIATKALLASSEMMRNINDAESYGIKVGGEVTVDYAAVVARKQKIINKLGEGIRFLFKKNNVEFLEGTAKIVSSTSLEVTLPDATKKIINADNIVIATGAKPAVIKGLEPDGELVMNSRQALFSATLPQEVLIIGAGAVGLEFADIYKGFGAKVTLVEAASHIVPSADKEVAFLASVYFKKQGMEILTEAKVNKLDRQNGKVKADIVKADGSLIQKEFDRVIVAVGVATDLQDLGLENLPDIKIEKGHIVTDKFCNTGYPNVYAIGDVTKAPWLAHKAMAEGILCAEHIAGGKNLEGIDFDLIPYCIYTHPQIAGFGITEEAAKEKGIPYTIGKFPLAANGKALAMGRPEGLIKIIKNKETGAIIGGAMVGAEVTELINALIPLPLKNKIFPHPTLSEIIPESLWATEGKSINS